jgi:vacuolar-type H+-ATPase subunit H
MSKLIVNCTTGEEIVRDLNKAEKDQQKLDEAKALEAKAIADAEAEAKEAQRQALLDRLGITSEEAKILLGA